MISDTIRNAVRTMGFTSGKNISQIDWLSGIPAGMCRILFWVQQYPGGYGSMRAEMWLSSVFSRAVNES